MSRKQTMRSIRCPHIKPHSEDPPNKVAHIDKRSTATVSIPNETPQIMPKNPNDQEQLALEFPGCGMNDGGDNQIDLFPDFDEIPN